MVKTGLALIAIMMMATAVQAAEERKDGGLIFKGVQLTEKKGDFKIWDITAASVEYKEGNVAYLEAPEILFYDKLKVELQVEGERAQYDPNSKIFILTRNVRLFSPQHRLTIFSNRVVCNYPGNRVESTEKTRAVTPDGATIFSQSLRSDFSMQKVDFKGPVRIEIPVVER